MVKVAIVEHVGGHGGMEFYDLGLCEALYKAGVIPILYTCDETTLDKDVAFRIRVKKVYKGVYGRQNKLIRGLWFLRGIFDASRDAKVKGCSIAHFHIFHFSWLEYVEMWIFRSRGFHIVATVHDVESFKNSKPSENRSKYGKFKRIIDRVIVHTRYAQRRLTECFSDYPSEYVHHILPLDFDRVFKTALSRSEARQSLNLPMRGEMILFFGQVKEVKGLDVLLDAFRFLVETGKNVFLVIAGKTWQVDFGRHERFIKENGLNDRVVKRVGYIANEMVPLYFRSADVIVLPYRKIFNSSVLQRALDYGTPVIVSDLGPLTEIIHDGENGLVFPVGDYRALAEKIARLIDDKDMGNQLVSRGRETINGMYDSARIGEQTRQVYEDALL